ncbi:MAG: spore protease YyaC [Bacillota bacterium]
MEEYPAITYAPAETVPSRFHVHYEEQDAAGRIANEIRDRAGLHTTGRPWVLLCIGTDRSTGDSLGPLVGSKVAAAKANPYNVYGTLGEPVHARNLKGKLQEVTRLHRNAFIIAVDASLGYPENVGAINVGVGPLLPGAGVNKSLPPVGHLHITAVVNIGGFMEYVVLQNTRLSVVMQQAEVIADALLKAAPHQNGMTASLKVAQGPQK